MADISKFQYNNVNYNVKDSSARNSITELSTRLTDIVTTLNADENTENSIDYKIKQKSYTKDEVDELILAIPGFNISIVNELPSENIDTHTIYLIHIDDSQEEQNVYKEYLYINNDWELIGDTKVNLSDYIKIEEISNENYEKLTEYEPNKLYLIPDDPPSPIGKSSVSNGEIILGF